MKIGRFSPAEVWRSVRRPFLWGAAAAVVGALISLIIPATYVVRAELALNSSTQTAISSSLLGLAQQFGLGSGGGAGTPDFLVALFTSEDVLESVVQTPFPRVTYADLWRTDCSPAADRCDPIHIWRIDGKNARDTLERAARKLSKAISVDLNPRNGIISMSVKGRTPELALAMADRLIHLVDSTNLELEREQARNQFRFMQEQVESARSALRLAEDSLADFDIANRSVQSSPMLLQIRGRLQRSISLAESFYVQLTSSLNQLYLAAANNVSTVGVVASPQLPGRRDWPKRTLIVIIAFVLGVSTWVGRNAIRQSYEEIRLALTRTRSS
jgi:hypothetical protein